MFRQRLAARSLALRSIRTRFHARTRAHDALVRHQSRRPRRLARGAGRTRSTTLARFLASTSSSHGEAAEQIAALRERLGNEKLVVAFVAEFSRGKSELINAIFFADTGRRILPATPGRTTMCPVELGWRRRRAARRCCCCRSRRASRACRSPSCARSRAPGAALALDVGDPDQLAQSLLEVTRTEWVSEEQARALGFWDDDDARRQPAARRRRPGRGAGVAPRADQLPAPAAQAGPGRARHAGPERDRRRARADAEPAAERARDRLHPRRRHRRHQVRPGDLARPPRRARADALRRAQQDRRARATRCARSSEVEAQIAQQQRETARTLGVPIAARVPAVGARRRWPRASAATTMALNESRLPALEAALGAQLLPQRRQVLEQVVPGRRAADREPRRAPPRRRAPPARRADARAARPARQERRQGPR